MQQRGEAHLLEQVEPVVARRAIGAERNVDAAREQVGHRRKAGTELEVRRRAVQHAGLCGGEDFPLLARGMNAVRERDIGAGQTNLVEKLNVVAPGQLPDEANFLFLLGGVRMQTQLVLAREGGSRAQQVGRAAQGEARRDGEAQAVVAAQLVEQQVAVGERVINGHGERRVVAGLVHQAVADDAHEAALLGGSEGRAGVTRGLHREERGDAAAQHLGAGEQGGGVEGVAVVRGLERPDVAAQPRQQRQVLGEAAEQRLREVDVALDQAGHDEAAAGIEFVFGQRLEFADADDAPAADQYAAVGDWLGRRRRPDDGVGDQDFVRRPRRMFCLREHDG